MSVVLAQPALSLTDLALGVVTLFLAIRISRLPDVHRHWKTTFWCFGGAALAGAIHHGFVVRWNGVADVSWACISLVVVLAVSYLLAGTVVEVLGPGHAKQFWLLRSVGLVAYVILAANGHAGVSSILLCESLTMAAILALWAWASYRRHPMAPLMVVAIAASGAAAGARQISPEVLEPIGLDPTSLYHLAQIAGMVALYVALTRPRREARAGGAAWHDSYRVPA